MYRDHKILPENCKICLLLSSITFALAVLPEMHEKAVFDVMVFPLPLQVSGQRRLGPSFISEEG